MKTDFKFSDPRKNPKFTKENIEKEMELLFQSKPFATIGDLIKQIEKNQNQEVNSESI